MRSRGTGLGRSCPFPRPMPAGGPHLLHESLAPATASAIGIDVNAGPRFPAPRSRGPGRGAIRKWAARASESTSKTGIRNRHRRRRATTRVMGFAPRKATPRCGGVPRGGGPRPTGGATAMARSTVEPRGRPTTLLAGVLSQAIETSASRQGPSGTLTRALLALAYPGRQRIDASRCMTNPPENLRMQDRTRKRAGLPVVPALRRGCAAPIEAAHARARAQSTRVVPWRCLACGERCLRSAPA